MPKNMGTGHMNDVFCPNRDTTESCIQNLCFPAQPLTPSGMLKQWESRKVDFKELASHGTASPST